MKKEVQLEAGEGDIIIGDREPYVITDKELLEKIRRYRKEAPICFDHDGRGVKIVEYIKGKKLSKTLVRFYNLETGEWEE